MKFENVQLLIDEMQDEISRMNYCWVDNQGLISKQNGVFRVNCIDCLDRTNVVQTCIAREVMMSQLIKLGLMSPETPHNLLSIAQQMWANNGDIISRQYAGTNALKIHSSQSSAPNPPPPFMKSKSLRDSYGPFGLRLEDTQVPYDSGTIFTSSPPIPLLKNFEVTCLSISMVTMGDITRTGNRKISGLMKDGMNSANRFGQSVDSKNLLITLVDSVASPLVCQLTPKFPATVSSEHFVFSNELRLTEFVFLVSRYYLSRFKDTTRQATLDIMLGNKLDENVIQAKDSSDSEDEGSSPVNEEESQLTIEHIKQVIDDIKKLLIEDPTSIIAAWALLSTTYHRVRITFRVRDVKVQSFYRTGEKLLREKKNLRLFSSVLSAVNRSFSSYDNELDKVTKFQEISLRNLKLLEIVVCNSGTNSTNSTGGQKSSSPSKSPQSAPIFTLHYCPDAQNPSFVLQHSFKSTNLRFFNNIAVAIKSDEEKIESLKAIAETIQIAYEVSGLGELEFITRVAQRKTSILLPENFRTSDVQFSSLKNVGSKALSNVSQQFSKFNKLGQSFKFSKNKPRNNVENSTELTETTSSQEAFLPTAGIVLSQTNIESVLNKDSLTNSILHNPQIIVDQPTAACAPVEAIEMSTKFEKSHSSDRVCELAKPSTQIGRSTSDKNLSLNFSAAAVEENALRSLKSGFASATNALVSPSSPLSRLAKGVQNLSSNLDPRRLRSGERSPEGFQIYENAKVKEKWLISGCRSKLIPL
ncbi:hypothetical protein ACFE04_019842 [Oxalis oulophora]